MDITIEAALASFGLSQKEIKIYLACLELGTTTANKISNKSMLNRSTTYDILKSFLEKGIASKIIRKRTIHFEIVNPERLVGILEEKKAKIQAVMPELKLLEKTAVHKPSVELYEGNEGVNSILNDILLTKKQTDVISTSKVFDVFVYSFPNYIRKRSKLKIPARVIQEHSPQTSQLKKSDKKENRITKSIKNFKLNSMTFIYGEKVAIIKLMKKDLIGILINDKIIAEDQRKIFELLWKTANP